MPRRARPVPQRHEVPLIGRAATLRGVAQRVEAGRATVLTGVAGVGKSRLSDEVAAAFTTRSGWKVVTRHATTTTRQLPLALFADLLEDATPRASAGEAMADAYRSLVEALPAGRSLVVVDDANLMDEPSALLVQRIVENNAAAVILTCRLGQPLPEGLAVLARSDRIATVHLDALTPGDAQQLAAAAAEGALSDDQLAEISRLAGGLPLFVLALVRQRGGRAVAEPVSTLAEVVARALGQPEPADLDALELVVLGEPLELTVLDRLTDGSALERLEGAGLIVVEADRRRRSVRVAHPVYAEAVASSLGQIHRRRQLRRLAQEVDTLSRRRDDTLRVVLWRLAAGDAVDADTITAAAQHAVTRGGLSLAEQLIDEHLDPRASVPAACLLAGIRLEQGRPVEAAAICEQAPDDGDDAALTRLAITWCITAFAYLGDLDATRRVLERFRSKVQPSMRHELDAFEITLNFYSGEVQAATDAVDALLAQPDLPERARVWFMMPGVLALATNGRVLEAYHHACDARSVAPSLAGEIVGIEAHACCVWAYASTLHGELRGCSAAVDEQLLRAVQAGDAVGQSLLTIVTGMVALYEGRLHDAAARLDVSGNVGGGWELAARAWRVQALALAGRADDARALLGSVATIPQFAFHHALNLYAAGEVEAASGNAALAATEFEAAAVHATGLGQHAYTVLALLRALVAAPTAERAERLVAVAPSLHGPIGQAIGDAARGWLAGDPASIDRGRVLLTELGSGTVALHLADLRAALAEQVVPGGAAARSAAHDAAQARQRLRDTGATVVAPRPTAPSRAAGAEVLTAREQEIVAKVATGLSDAEIATDLKISVRTVHAHLRSAYRKLGISSRRDL